MWLYFNSNGQLTTILEHGSPARAGSTQFKIFAVFEGIDNIDKLRDYSATIKLKKPDLTGSEYPTLLMELATAEFERLPNETNTGDFENLKTYYGFLFDFGSFNDSQEEEVLLDTQGLWEAVITLIKDDLFVQGVATFNVAGIGTEQETSDSTVYEIVTNQIVHNLNQRALKVQTILVINNWDELDLDEYEEGQLLLRSSDGMLFKVIIENETKDLEEVARFITIVDDALSSTSENPVQNKVINNALNSKLNASNESNSVYTTNGMIKYESDGATGHTIVRRTNNGYIRTKQLNNNSPEYLCTDKGYVDGKLTSKEDTNNKVVTINASSTDTQYPSAKCVYDNVQDTREIAAGKAANFSLSYGATAPNSANYNQYYYINADGDLQVFASSEEMTTYLSDLTMKNSDFNSENDSISFVVPYASSYYLLLRDNQGRDIIAKPLELYKIMHVNDNVIVNETGIPDRWVQTVNANYFIVYKLETAKMSDYYNKSESLIPTSSGTYNVGGAGAAFGDGYFIGSLIGAHYSYSIDSSYSMLMGRFENVIQSKIYYDQINILDTTYDVTLLFPQTRPLNCYPEYRIHITNSGSDAISITFQSSSTKLLTNDNSITMTAGVLSLPAGVSVECSLVNDKLCVVNWDI